MTRTQRLGAPQTGALFDELLVMLAKQGDRQALERLHHRWAPRLHRAALRYTDDAELAADLTQECWLSIWKGIKRLRDPARFRAFAFTILNRRGADYLRNAIRDRSHLSDTTPPDAPEDPVQEDRVAIRQAFAKLSPDQRLAAHLYFVEGLTLREIAQVQDIAEGTAKSRLFHARRTLKAALSSPSESLQGEAP